MYRRYALDLKSDSWNDLDKSEKKRIRNHFANIKRAVKMVLMHADSYPSIPEDPSQYKEVTRRIATAAEERIRNEFWFCSDLEQWHNDIRDEASETSTRHGEAEKYP